MEWIIPEIWTGTCYILGCGPSLNDVDLDRLKGQHVIAVNNAIEVAPWAPFMYFMDCIWHTWNEEKIDRFRGVKVSTCARMKNHPVIRFVHKAPKTNNWNKEQKFINRGSNSGFGGLCLGLKLGARRAILLGFDMEVKIDDDSGATRHNFHDDHKRPVKDSIYNQFRPGFAVIKEFFRLYPGSEVINATPGSALKQFPIVDPEEIYPHV